MSSIIKQNGEYVVLLDGQVKVVVKKLIEAKKWAAYFHTCH